MKDLNKIKYSIASNQLVGGSKFTINYLLFVLLSLLFSEIYGQQDSLKIQDHNIVMMARPQENGTIMLRWAVTTAKAWRKLNTHGYELKRYTITRNGNTLPQPIEKSIGVFKPKPIEEWAIKILEVNDNASIMAQSLYGETFEVEGVDELSAIVNLAEEQEQRFTWGLYAADQDYVTAQMAGLGFIDNEVMGSEKYVYKITSLVPETALEIKEGGVFIGLQDYEELPKPLDLAGVFSEGSVMLSWNYAIHKQLYNSYFIERSEDGKTFYQLNDLPLTSLNSSAKTDVKRMFYIDSITNNKTYHYRIKGRTPFGELSPVSDEVFGKAKKLLAYVPRITNKNYLENNSIILEWEFLKEGNKHITGFELNRSNKAKGTYKTVMKNIPSHARKIRYDHLEATNYFTITAIGKHGERRTSFEALVQPVDSIPPIKPSGFEGKIDSLGIVTLKWKANTEEDMLGYRVFRGNNKKEEYSQITVSPHRGVVYYDSISIKSLNSKVYYKLIAVDKRFNMSNTSEILELKKPDVIKPTQPIFKSYKIKDGKVHMTWANSSSEDVIKHEVYRKGKENTDWVMQYSVDSNQYAKEVEQWTDRNIIEGDRYSYTVIAIDDSALESDPAPPLTLTIPKTSLAPAIKGLNSYVDKNNGYIELYWNAYTLPNVAEIAIYKGLKDKPISLYKNVVVSVKRIKDIKVKPNNEYVYIVRVIFKDGTMSKAVKLNVKY